MSKPEQNLQTIPTSPFPGMDPYLECNVHWRGFHQYLATSIVDALNPQIVPKYYADVPIDVTAHAAHQELVISEQPPHLKTVTRHVYPDVTVVQNSPQPSATQVAAPASEATATITAAPIERVVEKSTAAKLRTVQIYLTGSKELVTAIEIFSPANKCGENLLQYQRKRSRIIQSDVHLIEIDLLRGGALPGPEVNHPSIDTDYVLLLNRADSDIYRLSKIWPVGINESLPVIPVPLQGEDADVALDLNRVVQGIYTSKYYGLRVDYNQPVPAPKLRTEMAEWWANQRV